MPAELPDLRALPWQLPEPRAHARWEHAAKRAMDLAVAIPGSAVLLLLLPFVALAIRLDSSGSVFFPATRYGRGGHSITVWKFRSMVSDAEQRLEESRHLSTTQGPSFKAPSDPRVTRVGRWLRRTSLDELPQLFNVLAGNMSVVGPRPVQDLDFRGYEAALPVRHLVKPGMTGAWQVAGRSNLPFDVMATLDLTYALRWSIWGDVVILLRTIPAVLTGRGAV